MTKLGKRRTIASGFLMRTTALTSAAALVFASPAWAVTVDVANYADLVSAISQVNANTASTINFTGNVTLAGELNAITRGVTITGNGFTLSGANAYRGLFIAAGSGNAVGISNLTIANGYARGGNAGASGGGGMGAGGGIFAMSGAITLTNVSFSANAAKGGNGSGGGGGQGGGGMGGDGGQGGFGSGGGGVGLGASGGSGTAGGAGILPGGSGGSQGNAGGANSGGGGSNNNNGGAGGGLGGVTGTTYNGGSGGFGGGGGGGTSGGDGGFGGGGGGGQGSSPEHGGHGGYGGGGGGAVYGGAGYLGGFGGGAGSGSGTGVGGGGMGAGGSIFVCTSTADPLCGATLTISNTANNSMDGSVTAGSGNQSGAALGGAIFLAAGAQANYSVASGTTTTISGSIAGDYNDLGVAVSGGGTLVLASTSNSFTGLTASGNGTRVGLGGTGALGNGAVSLGDGTGFVFTANGSFSNALTVTGDPIFDTQGNTITYAGLIADGTGPGDVEVIGGGTLILTNASNSYTGGTVVFAGSTVSIDSDGELGGTAGGVTLGDATTTGTLAVTQNITSARTITLDAGGGIISAPFGKTLTLSGQVTGSGGLTVSGPGGIYLTGNTNNYSGGTTIASGFVTAGRANVLGTGPLAIEAAGLLDLNNRSQSITSLTDGGDVHGGTIGNSAGGAATLTIGSDNSDSAFSGVIQSGSGTISLVKTGTGTLTLSGANTYTGGTTIGAGILQVGVNTVGSHGAITSSAIGTGALTLNGGTLQFGGDYTIANDIALGTGSGTIDANSHVVMLSGNITGSTGITFADSGTSPSSILGLSGNNTYSGTTTIGSGEVDARSATALSASSDYVVNGTGFVNNPGHLDLDGYSQTIRSLSGDALGEVSDLGGAGGTDATLTIAPTSGGTFAGTISDDAAHGRTLALVMNGQIASTQVLSGANSYSGGTTLTAGTLEIGNAGALSSGAVTFDGGTLKLDGNYTIGNAIQVNAAGGAFDSGGHTTGLSGNITGTGVLAFTNAGSVSLTGDNSGFAGGLLVAAGTLTLNGASTAGTGAIAMINSAVQFSDDSYANNFRLTGTGSLIVGDQGSITLHGVISDTSTPAALYLGTTGYSGNVELDGANTYSNGTEIHNVSVVVGADTVGTAGHITSGALGTGTVTIDGTYLTAGGDYTLANDLVFDDGTTLDAGGHAFTLSGHITGSNGGPAVYLLSNPSGGSIALTDATNTFSSGTNIISVTAILTGSGGTGAGPLGTGTVGLNQATLRADVSGHLDNPIDVTYSSTLRATNGTYAFGAISGGAPTLTLGAAGDTGTVSLSDGSSYTGGITIAGSAVLANGTTPFGDTSNTVVMQDGSTLAYADQADISNPLQWTGNVTLGVASGSATQSGDISDDSLTTPYTVTKTGAGTLVLSGANTSSANVRLSAGTLEINNQNALGGGTYVFDGGTLKVDGAWTIGNDFQVLSGGTFDTGSYNTELTGTLSSGGTDGALTITGTGSVKVLGLNNLSGGAVIDSGTTLEVAGASGIGAGDVTMGAGSAIHFTTITNGTFTNHFLLDGDPIFNVDNGITTTLSRVIADAPSPALPGVLEKTGTGTLVLSGANTYSGGTVLSAGILFADTTTALGSGALTLDGGVLTSHIDPVLANAIAITANGGTIQVDDNNIELAGIIGDDSHGGGVLSLTSDSTPGIVILDSANTYSQGTSIGSGVTALAKNNASFSSGTITLDGGKLTAVSNANLTIGNDIALTDNGGTILGNGTTLTLSGVIADAAGYTGAVDRALTIGAGGAADTSIVILSGNNTYSGGSFNSTVIEGGTVVAGHNSAFGTTFVTIDDGATLEYGAGRDIANVLYLNGNAKLDVEGSDTATQSGSILEVAASSLEKTGSGTLVLMGSGNYSGKTVVSAGTLQESYYNAIPYNSDVEVASGAPLAIDGGLGSVDIGSLADHAGAGGTVTIGSGTELFVGGAGDNSSNTTFSGSVTGGDLAYDGTGTLTLTGSANSVEALTICGCGTTGGIILSGGHMSTSYRTDVENGTLTVQDGAVLEASGQGFASTGGAVLVTGIGSAITVLHSATAYNDTAVTTDYGSTASQTIAAGGTFTTTGDSYIGTDGTPGATATGLVTGVGSIWTVNHFYVGGGQVAGKGMLTVADGGKVVAPDGVSLALGSTLNIGNGGLAGIIDAPTISGGGSNKIVANFTDTSTLSAQLTGGLTLTQQGSGTLILTGANTNSGLTTISGGTLQVGNGGTLGSGAVTNNANLVFNTSTPVTVASIINGSGKLLQQGSGALTLTSTDGYTGETSIAANATLKLSGSGRIQSSSVVTDNGVLDISGVAGGTAITTLAGNGSVLLGSKTLQFLNGSTTFSGSITDGGAGGSVDFAGGDQILTGTNSWTGTTSINAGATVTVASPASLGGSSLKLFNGATLKFTGDGTYALPAEFAQVNAPIYDVGTSTVIWSGQITGVGDLAVIGNGGTLTLTNATNSYGGGTEVTGGAALKVDADGELGATATTLQLGDATTAGMLRFASAFTLNAARNVVLGAGGGIIDTNGNDVTIAQAISGGGLTKTGTGTLILTGANSYTGATVISAGTLQIGNGGTTGSITGNVTDNATLAFNRSDAVTFALAVSGSGGIVHRGGGTLTLSGASSYAGDTAVAGSGALAISAANNIGNGAGTLILGDATHNGVLQLVASTTLANAVTLNAGGGTLATGGTNLALNGVVGGTGSLTVTGNGSATLASAATYSGATTIDSGTTLALSGAGGVAASSGITDSGTFDISATTSGAAVQSLSGGGAVVLGARTLSITNAAGTFAGVISGTGGVTVAGGTVTFSGANSYGGTTTIASGATLLIGSGGAIGTGAIADNGILRFGRSDSVTVAGALSGSGSLVQNGGGNLTLTGTGAFSGSAVVNGGTLSVNGAIGAATATVNSGGTLGGTGTIGATTVASGGTIAPGNSIGTLHVSGNMALASGSITAIEISPTAADQIAVSGTAALGGTLAFSQGAGTYTAGTDFKLITASSVSGVFSSVTGLNVTGLNANVIYSATAVDLTLATPASNGGSGGGGTVTNSFLFGTYGKTPNQIAAGAALAAGANTGTLYVATGNLVATNVASVPGALGQMAGDIHASVRGAVIEDSRIIRNAVLGRLDQGGEGAAVWGSAFGGYGSIAGDGNAAALHHDSAGIIAGVDMPVSDGLRAGIAAAYSTDRASTSGHLSTAGGNNGHIIGYAGWTGGAFDLKLGGDYGWGTIHTARQVTALGQALAGRQDQRMDQVFADAGYRIASDPWMIEPYVDIAHVDATSGSFAEQGGSAALSGGSVTDGLTYGTLGLRAALAGISLQDIGIAPKIDLGWRHAFDTLKPGQLVSFQDTGTSFTVLGAPLGTDAAALQLGFDVSLTPDAKLSLGYDGTFGSHAQNNAVRGAFQWAF